MSNKKQKKVLGRGLDALLNTSDDTKYKKENLITPKSLEIDIKKIQVNPNQPRTNFDSSEIENLLFLSKIWVLFNLLQLEKLVLRILK